MRPPDDDRMRGTFEDNDNRNGSKGAANFLEHGAGICLNTGRQSTQPLHRFLIDEMIVSANAKRRAYSTPASGRHGRRPRLRR